MLRTETYSNTNFSNPFIRLLSQNHEAEQLHGGEQREKLAEEQVEPFAATEGAAANDEILNVNLDE